MSTGERTYLASIHIYPVKAMRAVDLGECRVEPWGLKGDRRWLVVDPAGRYVSQRKEPSLARVTASYEDQDLAVTLAAQGRDAISIPAPSAEADAEVLEVRVGRRDCVIAAAAGRAADEWLPATWVGQSAWYILMIRDGVRSTRNTPSPARRSASPMATRCW